MRLVVNRSNILHQMIGGETVIVNLTTGTYYSLRYSCADIWSLIEQGVQRNLFVQTLGERYEASAESLDQDVTRILEELEKEGLLVASAEDSPSTPHEPLQTSSDSAKLQYTPPQIEKFEDMQDLILLDPIHEVDEDEGWPHLKPSN